MKLIFLPASYFPSTLGGTETYVHEMAKELSRQGQDVVVAYHGDAQTSTRIDPNYRVEVLAPLRNPTRMQLYRNSFGEPPPSFSEFIEREAPDLIHFHAYTLGSGIDHANVARQFGIPYVVTYHVPNMSCPRGTLFRWGRKVCHGVLDDKACAACVSQKRGFPIWMSTLLSQSKLSAERFGEGRLMTTFAIQDLIHHWSQSWQHFMFGANHIVACAQWCKDVLKKNGIPSEKITVLRQALPGTGRVRTLRLPLPKDRKIRLGFMGRFTRVKEPDGVLKAAIGLRELGIENECELVGPIHSSDDNWATKVLKEYKNAGRYLGVKKGQELKDWIKSLDMLIIPGRWMETGPLTLLEAWEHGVPVAGVKLGGVEEFMTPAGFSRLLFAPTDVRAMIEAVMNARNWTNPCPQVNLPGLDQLCRDMLHIYENALQSSYHPPAIPTEATRLRP